MREVLKTIPDESVKLVFADYPFKLKGKKREEYFKFIRETAGEFYRVAAKDGWVVVLNNPTNLFRSTPFFQQFEFRNQVVLIKRHTFHPPGMFGFKHNAMWILSKKKQKLKLKESSPDVLEYRNGYWGKAGRHPEAIPEWLAELIITATTKEGDVILDAFAGSGTVPLVAERLNRKWIGAEVNTKYLELIRNRFERASYVY